MPAHLEKPLSNKTRADIARGKTYFQAFAVVILCTIIAAAMFPYFSAENLSMVYLAGIVISALYFGRGPSILTTILSVAAFDFLFTEPYETFAISDAQYVLTLFVMLLVAVTISNLAVGSRQQTELARARERHTASLYSLNQKFSNAQGMQSLIEMASRHIAAEFDTLVVIFVADSKGELKLSSAQPPDTPQPDLGIAQWVFTSGQRGGYETGHVSDNPFLYIPLRALQKSVGVLAIYAQRKPPLRLPERAQFLETFCEQVAVAIEQTNLAEEAQKARTQAEAERLRSSLLSSVSHDLRTPLASIMGAASTLQEKGLSLDTQTHAELAQVAYEEAERLNRLVGNLLDMMRLESGGLKIEKEWQTLEEVVGATLRYLGKRRRSHHIVVDLPPDLPLIAVDTVLIEQALVNLLENALKYTPPGSDIIISASAVDKWVTIEIADQGPGIASGDEEKIFDKFYRSRPKESSGVGLGLSICKGIIEAHSGHIGVRNRPSHGAIFSITIPLEGQPPELDEEL